VGRVDLRVVAGGNEVPASALDAPTFQAACVDGFVGSRSARGFSDSIYSGPPEPTIAHPE
jgi:hypothetical protein